MICPLLKMGLMANTRATDKDGESEHDTGAECVESWCAWYCNSYPAKDGDKKIGSCAVKWFGDSLVRKFENGWKEIK